MHIKMYLLKRLIRKRNLVWLTCESLFCVFSLNSGTCTASAKWMFTLINPSERSRWFLVSVLWFKCQKARKTRKVSSQKEGRNLCLRWRDVCSYYTLQEWMCIWRDNEIIRYQKTAWGITHCTIKTEKLLDNNLLFTPFLQVDFILTHTQKHFHREKITFVWIQTMLPNVTQINRWHMDTFFTAALHDSNRTTVRFTSFKMAVFKTVY